MLVWPKPDWARVTTGCGGCPPVCAGDLLNAKEIE